MLLCSVCRRLFFSFSVFERFDLIFDCVGIVPLFFGFVQGSGAPMTLILFTGGSCFGVYVSVLFYGLFRGFGWDPIGGELTYLNV